MASTIKHLFPTKCAAAYFTEFRMENGIRFPGTVKLRNLFEYLKGHLRAQGIFKSVKSHLKEQNTAVNTTILSNKLYITFILNK